MILFALIMVLLVWDIAEDLTAGTTFFHVVMESIMILVAAFGAFYFWNQHRIAKRAESALKQDLKKARAEAVHWQAKERDSRHTDGAGSVHLHGRSAALAVLA